jgi:hypothetical protein
MNSAAPQWFARIKKTDPKGKISREISRFFTYVERRLHIRALREMVLAGAMPRMARQLFRVSSAKVHDTMKTANDAGSAECAAGVWSAPVEHRKNCENADYAVHALWSALLEFDDGSPG